MKDISIGRKIFIGFFILIVFSASFLLISFTSLSKIDALNRSVVPLSYDVGTLHAYGVKIKQLESKLELYMTIKSDESREQVVNAVQHIEEFVDTFKDQKAFQPKDVSGLTMELAREVNALIGFLDNRASAYKINLQIISVNKLFQKIEDVQEALQQQRLSELQNNVDRQNAITGTLVKRFLIVEFFIIIFGFVSSFVLSRLIVRGLSKLDRGTREIAKGNFDAHIDVASRDEIGQLAHSFNMMAKDLRAKTVSKEYVDNIIRNMAETLVVADPQLSITSVNTATCSLLDYQEPELLGKPLESLFDTDSVPFEKVRLQRCISEGKTLNCEVFYRAKDSKVIPVLFSASPMYDKEGSVICLICVARDITERKKTEEKLREIAEMKSKLISVVSHEIRTPLAAIKAGIAIVTDGLAGSLTPEQKDILDTTQRNVNRLTRLIDQFLDFQKLEAGKTEFKREENDINAIVNDVCKSMLPLCTQKGLKLQIKLDYSLPKPLCDKERIAEVVHNLISNAIKFTKAGGIDLETSFHLGRVYVKVSDTGIGIRKENMPRLFHSFEQMNSPEGLKTEGTGLGLAICKDIVDQHYGTIWAESDGEGKGATFVFALPIRFKAKETGNFLP